MSNIALYLITVYLLFYSYKKDKNKTKIALKKGLKSFENIMPQFLGIIVLIGILLSVFNSDTISKIIGKESGFIGVILLVFLNLVGFI